MKVTQKPFNIKLSLFVLAMTPAESPSRNWTWPSPPRGLSAFWVSTGKVLSLCPENEGHHTDTGPQVKAFFHVNMKKHLGLLAKINSDSEPGGKIKVCWWFLCPRGAGWEGLHLRSNVLFHVKDDFFHVNMKKHLAAKGQNALRHRRRQEIINSDHLTKEMQRKMTAGGENLDNPTLTPTIRQMFCFMLTWKKHPAAQGYN